MSQLDSENRAKLREFISERFNLDELKTLCFDLGLDYEEFPHATKSEFSRELIVHFQRHNKMGCLVAELIRQRPDEWLTGLLAQVSSCRPNEKVQIVLSNDKIKSRPDLKQKLAELLGISADEVMILATAAGSVKVLVGLPPGEAGKLIALPLPYQLHEYEIVSVTPYVKLPPAVQSGWRTAVTRTTLATTTATATGGGLSLVVKILIGLLILAGIITAGVLIVRSRQPELTVYNSCPNPLPIPAPEAVRSVLSLPEAIPPGGSMNVPVITGTGTYELLVTREGMMVLVLPRAIPGVGSRVELGMMDRGTAVTLNGRPLNPPQQFQIETGQNYELVICAPR